MKTTKKLAYFCVAVLSDVFCLTSCTSEEVNPNYDAERGVVKTEFTISIPAKPAGTRMSAETVQAGASTDLAKFRGIEGIKLYSFKSKVDDIGVGTTLPSIIDLLGGQVSAQGPSGATDNTIASSGALFTTGNNAHLYKDIEVPIGTQAFMFYGMAIPSYGTSTPTSSDLIANGTLTDNLSPTPPATLGDITFSPVQIYGSSLGDNATLIVNYLNNIASAAGWSASENVVLQTLYQNFITMRAGSWASVKGAVQQLYSSLWNKDFVADSDDNIKDAILKQITNSTYASDAGGTTTPNGTLNFQKLGNFPADLSLPDGAIYLSRSGDQFQIVNFPGVQYSEVVLPNGTTLVGYYSRTGTEGNYTYTLLTGGTADGATAYYKKSSDNTGLDIPNLNKYVYPAPLYYRALSNIRTANVSKAAVYNSATSWADVLTGTGGYGAEVSSGENRNDIVRSTTRSIAIVDQVQYAVGRLDAIVHTNNGAASLKDYTGADISIKSNEATPTYYFPVTGILIGNQNSVDYQFHKKGTEGYTIYDNAIPTGACLTEKDATNATPIHTLVFETADATKDNDENAIVNIAVEFLNNSRNLFVGRYGEIIYPGSKFYLLGTFDPNLNANQSTPVYYAGTTIPIKRAFVQDYVTTANLVISSLRNAYNTMPDLRAPQLELGLSVDLTWQTGISQTITIP